MRYRGVVKKMDSKLSCSTHWRISSSRLPRTSGRQAWPRSSVWGVHQRVCWSSYKNVSIKKYVLSTLSQDLGFPGNSPRTTASLPFTNISSRPRSLAVCALESQGNVVYCFNICLTQSKPSSSDSLSVICISVKEISRQIRCLGAHHGMVVFAIGSLLQKWDPHLQNTKATILHWD